MRNLRQYRLSQLFIIYLRYLIGVAFVFASMVKIRGERFTAISGAEHPIGSAWHFFETLYASGLYWQFIGVAQFVAGALLLTQKYARLGAFIFLPIIVNIFVITISHDFGMGTPVITFLMLCATFLLIVWEWPVLQVLLNRAPQLTVYPMQDHKIWAQAGLVLLLLTLVIQITARPSVMLLWLTICILIGLGTLAIAWRKGILYEVEKKS